MNNFILNVVSVIAASIITVLLIFVLIKVWCTIPSLISKLMDFELPTSANKSFKNKERALNMAILIGYSREIIDLIHDMKSGKESYKTLKLIEYKLQLLFNLNEHLNIIPKNTLIDLQVFLRISKKYSFGINDSQSSQSFFHEECDNLIQRIHEIIRLGTVE